MVGDGIDCIANAGCESLERRINVRFLSIQEAERVSENAVWRSKEFVSSASNLGKRATTRFV